MVFLGLDTSDLTGKLTDAEKKTKKSNEKMQKHLKAGFKYLATAAAAAAALAAAAFAKFVKDSVSEFITFEHKMNEVFTLLPDISKKGMGQMSKDAQEVARELGILPEEIIPALYQAISAGVPKENVMDFLRTAGAMSIGGVTDLKTAVDVLTTATAAYAKEGLTAEEASDSLFQAMKGGKLTITDIAETIGRVLPVAAELGIGTRDLNAAFAVLSKTQKPAEAITALRSAILAAGAATPEAEKLLDQMGLSSAQLAETLRGPNGIVNAFTMLKDASKGNNSTLRSLLGTKEGLLAVSALTANSGQAFAEALDAQNNAAGSTRLALDRMNTSMQRQLDIVKATFSVGLIRAGEAFSALFKSMGPVIQNLANRFADLDWSSFTEAMVRLGQKIGPAVMELAEAFGGLVQDLVNAGGGADLFANKIIELINTLVGAIEVLRLVTTIVTELNKLLGKTGSEGSASMKLITNKISGLVNPATLFLNVIKEILGAFKTLGPAIRAALTGDVFKFVGEIEKLLLKLAAIVEKIPMVGKDAAASIREGAKGIGKMGEEFRKIEERAANQNKQKEPKPTGPSFIEGMMQKKREEEAKKLEENRKALFALTKKPFWLTATIEDFRKVNEDILEKGRLAMVAQEIGPKQNLVIGSKAYNREEVIGALGRTPEEVMAMRRGMSKFQITQSDRRIKDAIEQYIISLENAGEAAQKNQDETDKNFFTMIQKAGGPSAELHRLMRSNLRTDKQRQEFDKRIVALYNKGVQINHQELMNKTREFFGGKIPSSKISLPSPLRTQPLPMLAQRPVGPPKPMPVKIDTQEMMKRMNTFYGTAIKDIQKSLKSIDHSLKGKFVNQ